MKKNVVIALLAIFLIIGAGQPVHLFDKDGTRIDPGQVHTARVEWVAVDTTSSTGTEPTDLAVTERTYQLAKTAQGAAASGDDEISFYDIPRSWNSIRFRAIGITDDGTYKTRIYLGTLGDGNRDTDSTSADCEMAYVGYLEWTIGTQTSETSTYELADAVTVTASDWPKSWLSKSPGSNRVAEATIDLMGADLLCVVPDNASADSKLLAKGY